MRLLAYSLLIFMISACDENSHVSPKGEPILLATNLPKPTKAIDLVAGDAHVCAHLEDFTIKCWGDNGLGALNIQSARNAQKKYYDVSKAAFTKITASHAVTCGILKDPPYEGIPVCFGQEGEWLDVPHEKVKDISTGSVTCFIKQDDTLGCVGPKLMLATKAVTWFDSNSDALPLLGIDPTSGAERQDYSTKRFKDVKSGFNKVCARGFDDVVYCMGDNNRGKSVLGAHSFLDYDAGNGQMATALKNDGILHIPSGHTISFNPIPNITKPETLKYKKILDRGWSFLTTSVNRYDNGSPIPENTLVTGMGFSDEGVIGFVTADSSYKADRFGLGCLLTDKHKVRCYTIPKNSPIIKPTDILNKIPKEIAE